MLKHVGRHGDRKVVIMYRTVPDEEHMCLVSYSEVLPRIYHDAVMQVLESPVGQQAKELAEALFRNLLPDGRNILTSLHREGLIKKVPTNQIIVTPDTKSNVRLDELNDILQTLQAQHKICATKRGDKTIYELASETHNATTRPE